MSQKITAGRDQLGELAPQFAALNDDVLFGEVWANEAVLPPKIRSMITISTLMGKGILDASFEAHLRMGKVNGITKDEMVALVTQVAFYAGWPNAWAAFRLLKDIYGEPGSDALNHGGIFGMGEFNEAFSSYFSGKSYLKTLTKEGDYLPIHNVTFEPGCRNNWHIHQATSGGGQVLICVEGEGWYQEEGKPAQKLQVGDIVEIPANVKHWHGATKDSWFSHVAFSMPGENTANEWLEPVSEEDYQQL